MSDPTGKMHYRDAQFTANDKQIVFTLDYGEKRENDICIINTDGSQLRVLAHGEEPNASPINGDIAYTDYENRDSVIKLITADGTNERTLGKGRTAHFAPNGECVVCVLAHPIIFHLRDGQLAGVEDIIPHENRVLRPFLAFGPDNQALFQENTDDVELVQITPHGIAGQSIAMPFGSHVVGFIPGTKTLLYIDYIQGLCLVTDLRHTEKADVIPLPAPIDFTGCISPDGKYILKMMAPDMPMLNSGNVGQLSYATHGSTITTSTA